MTASERAVVVGTIIDRSPAQVWADVRDIASHVDWMHDAVEIRFLSNAREGLGTRFECDTKVGPFSLTDVMEITAWDDEQRMGVRHVGLVEGTGEFTLRDLGSNRTEFRWQEDLFFPWFMGGPIGAFLARPILRFIWNRNLARLKARIEAS
ncbi:MAG: SRPBCC family protein [Acidimicrobiia bacterium]|nr:SRPBCC family protein [Acidimicrobiia bacterium]